MTKFLGIILASIFSVILAVQVVQVRAQVADTPMTSPITSPITGPMASPTVSPTPTLITSLTSTPMPTGTVTVTMTPTVTPTLTPSITLTPTVSPTITPSITMTPTPTYTVTPTPSVTQTPTVTPTPSAVPTPLPTNVSRLGGLNLDGYCAAVGNSFDTVVNGQWYCGNGSAQIDMSAACQWQNARTDTFAFQDRPTDVYSWSCYAVASTVTPAPTVTITPTETMTLTPTPSDSITMTPTPSVDSVSLTPTMEVSPTQDTMPTETPTPLASDKNHHDKHIDFPFHFQFHGVSLKALFNAVQEFGKTHGSKQKEAPIIKTEACTMHDADDKRFVDVTPKVASNKQHKDMIVSMRFK